MYSINRTRLPVDADDGELQAWLKLNSLEDHELAHVRAYLQANYVDVYGFWKDKRSIEAAMRPEAAQEGNTTPVTPESAVSPGASATGVPRNVEYEGSDAFAEAPAAPAPIALAMPTVPHLPYGWQDNWDEWVEAG